VALLLAATDEYAKFRDRQNAACAPKRQRVIRLVGFLSDEALDLYSRVTG